MINVSANDTLSHYFDPQFNREVVKIKPGEYFATNRQVIIATVLGSCVAACIRDSARGNGGMNHFMLPHGGSGSVARGVSALRYGIFAMETLINELIKRGSRRDELEAKVFGGAAVVDSIHADIGAQNAEFVEDYLGTEGIRTTVRDLGGDAPRKVLFFVEDGRVLVKYLWRLKNDTIARRETEYAQTFSNAPAAAADLF